MGYFGATRAAIAKERHVIAPNFVLFDFHADDGGPVRYWEGLGDIVIDGETWSGLGELGSIADAAFGIGDAAGNIVYQLSGVSPEIVALAQAQASLVRGREVTLFGQFLDRDSLQPLDDLYVLRVDVMDRLAYSGQGPSGRTVQLFAENFWTSRLGAANAYYSARDQEYRFPGDRGLDYVVTMRNKRVDWPLQGAF